MVPSFFVNSCIVSSVGKMLMFFVGCCKAKVCDSVRFVRQRPRRIARMTLTTKGGGNWVSVQLANSTPR